MPDVLWNLVTRGLVVVTGEVRTSAYIDVPTLVRNTILDIGYNRAKFGFDGETCAVITSIEEQSPDIAWGLTDPSKLNQKKRKILLRRLEQETRALCSDMPQTKRMLICLYPFS